MNPPQNTKGVKPPLALWFPNEWNIAHISLSGNYNISFTLTASPYRSKTKIEVCRTEIRKGFSLYQIVVRKPYCVSKLIQIYPQYYRFYIYRKCPKINTFQKGRCTQRVLLFLLLHSARLEFILLPALPLLQMPSGIALGRLFPVSFFCLPH